MNCIRGSETSLAYSAIRDNTLLGCEKISHCLVTIDDKIGMGAGLIAAGTDKTFSVIGNALGETIGKTAKFIKNNWKPLLSYLLAWGVILACTGLMYGFQAVTLPLTIGSSCGGVFGVITGILTVKVFDPSGKISLWNLLNQGIEGLDPNGTRQIVLAVAVTVLLAASVVFPYVMGAVIGIFIGNQVATKICSERNLGRDPEKARTAILSIKQKIEDLEQKCDDLSKRIAARENATEIAKIREELLKMTQSIQTMQSDLNKLQQTTNKQ